MNTPLGRRRRRVVAALIGGLGLTGASLVVSAGVGAVNLLPTGHADPPTLDRNIEDYALFAYDSLAFQGSGGATITGNIGVNNPVPDNVTIRGANTPGTLTLCAGGHATTMADRTQVVADRVIIGDGCKLWDLWNGGHPDGVYGSLSPNATVHDFEHFDAPIIPAGGLPQLPPMACDRSRPVRSIALFPFVSPLDPGTYGDALVMSGSGLILRNGTYTFCGLRTGQNVTITAAPGADLNHVTINVVGTMNIGSGSHVGFYTGPGDNSGRLRFNVLGTGARRGATIRFAKSARIVGQFFAPNGLLALGNNNALFGNFWAKTIASDFNDTVTGVTTTTPPPTVPTTTTPPTTRPSTTTTTVPPTTTSFNPGGCC